MNDLQKGIGNRSIIIFQRNSDGDDVLDLNLTDNDDDGDDERQIFQRCDMGG